MPAVATENFDNSKDGLGGRSFDDGPNGLTGVRHFRVKGTLDSEILSATGLPQQGEAWPGFEGILIARRRRVSWWGGDAANDNGWWIVRVEYANPAVGGNPELAQEGESYSEAQSSVQQVTINHGQIIHRSAASDPTNLMPPGTGGDVPSAIPQIQQLVPVIQIRVTSFRTNRSPWSHWATIATKRNSNEVTIPPRRGIPGTSIIAQPGELLARELGETYVRPDLFAMTYTFSYGQRYSHLVPFRRRDGNGEFLGGDGGDIWWVDPQGEANFNTGLLW